MSFERIIVILESLGLKDKYLQNFIDNALDDEAVQHCLEDPQFINDLNAAIPLPGHRIKFCKAFKSTPVSPVNDWDSASYSNRIPVQGSTIHPESLFNKNALPNGPSNQQPAQTSQVEIEQEALIDLSEPQPVQIMVFEESKKYGAPSKVVFHKNFMEQILSKAKSKKVGVLAIAGPSRKGKSFFLNFVLRYLNGLKTNDTNWMGWNQSSRLDGFTWKNCAEIVTTGIWIWSELFTLKSENEEFDLLVMDTQGVFDEHTTQREWSILIGLGLHTSSCLIFNIMSDLQEDYLQVFENFLSFGLLALDSQDDRAPFQKLVFLIRDWNIPSQFPYGSSGGKTFIEQKLDTKGYHQESHKRVRQQLRQCFEEISCFLLPHPGQIVLESDFDGSAWKSQYFAAEIEKCVLELINPLNFPLKKVNGNFLSSQDILSTFQLFCDLFNSDELPNPESVFEITAKNCNALITKKCLEVFTSELHNHLEKRTFLPHEELLKVKIPAEQYCLEMFEKARKMGDKTILQKAKANLEEAIEAAFKTIAVANHSNLERAITALDMRVNKIVNFYIEDMVSKTQGNFVSEEQLENLHELKSNTAISEFDELDPHQDLRQNAEINLKNKLIDEYTKIKAAVLLLNEKIQSEGRSLVVNSVSRYRDEVKSKMTLNEDTLMKVQEEEKLSVQKIFVNLFPVNGEDLFEQFIDELVEELEKCDLELSEIFLRNKKEFQHSIQNAKDSAFKNYCTAMQHLLHRDHQSSVELEIIEKTHNEKKLVASESLKNNFVQYDGVDKNLLNEFLKDLEQSADDHYTSLKKQIELRMDNTAAKGAIALSEIKELYVNRMREAVESSTNEQQLREMFDLVTRESLEKLQENLEALPSSSVQEQHLLEALQSYMAIEFEGTQEVFRMKMEEDEIMVKSALLEAKIYYNEEMEKHVESKDWLENEELKNLHASIIEGAVEKGKTEVELSPSQEKQLREVLNISYQKYYEMNLLRMPSESYAIGIDLGTTYSCVAVCIKGKVKVIPCDGKNTVPSFVSFDDDHTIHVGEAAKEQTFRRPESTIFDAKRLIGRKFSDKIVQDDLQLLPYQVVNDNDQPKIKLPDHSKTYRPEEISACVLVHLKKMAEDYLNKKVTDAVITVPAYFSDSQRQATKDAAQMSGLNARILNEPTSAAIAYELHRTDDLKRNILIFDLGGGTFDVAVLNIEKGEVNVKAIGGDTHLGGEDFDNDMVKHIIDIVKIKHGIDLGRGKVSSNPTEMRNASERFRRIRAVCEKQKRILSTSESTTISIPRIDGNFNLEERFTRADFECLNLAKFKKCIDVTDKVIADAKMKKSEIEDIVLIGGSTRIPKIRKLLTEFFDGKALNSQINADEAVAYGAAIQAALEHGKSNEVSKKISVSDVTPMSLGIRVATGELSVIVPKNTTVPCRRTYTYLTSEDAQTNASINIFEGEELMANDNTKLGNFSLSGIPSAPQGKELLDVSMIIDREGILHVEAVCRSTGTSKSIRIEAYKGRMSGTEILSAKTNVINLKW